MSMVHVAGQCYVGTIHYNNASKQKKNIFIYMRSTGLHFDQFTGKILIYLYRCFLIPYENRHSALILSKWNLWKTI